MGLVAVTGQAFKAWRNFHTLIKSHLFELAYSVVGPAVQLRLGFFEILHDERLAIVFTDSDDMANESLKPCLRE